MLFLLLCLTWYCSNVWCSSSDGSQAGLLDKVHVQAPPTRFLPRKTLHPRLLKLEDTAPLYNFDFSAIATKVNAR